MISSSVEYDFIMCRNVLEVSFIVVFFCLHSTNALEVSKLYCCDSY
uniref:Uncharacterized protein n=1 Tax=Rhizophora mucronata TaxID=61149 RepID=A0A2P2MGL0_RHIMU